VSIAFVNGRDQHDLALKMDRPIIGTKNLHQGANVNGKTLIFSTPAATVTFTDPDPVTLEQIVAEINGTAGLAGTASIYVEHAGGSGKSVDRRLLLNRGDSTTVLTNPGTANADLGFATSGGDQTQDPYPYDRIRAVGQNLKGGGFYAVVSTDP
jgi:hypothetical protein